ncbi:MAG: tetratricopeptide repeat protein, partial [Bacteroidales bacterium]
MFRIRHILQYIIFAVTISLFPVEVNAQRTEKEFSANVGDLFKSQKWEEGKSVLDRGLSRYNESSLLRVRLGQYYMHHANYDAARYQLEKALKFDIDNDNARRYLVQVEMDTKRYSIALCYINELLENFPYDKQLWLKKISLFIFRGDYTNANAYMKRLSEIYYNDGEIFTRYMNQLQEAALKLKKRGDISSAIANYEILIEKGAGSVDDYLDLINIFLQKGDIEKALFYSDKSVMQHPDSVRVIEKRAGVMAGQGRYDDALAFLKMKMLSVSSGLLQKQYNDMLLEYGDFDKSRKYDIYREAFGRMPENTQVLDYLIAESFRKGYYENALNYIDVAEKYIYEERRNNSF